MLPNLAALGARGGTTGAPGADNRPLHLTELPPEMLKEILLAVDTGDVEMACNTADAWCGVDTNVRGACADANLWTQLTKRVFGVEREAGSADVATHRAFFRELCALRSCWPSKRATARRRGMRRTPGTRNTRARAAAQTRSSRC